MITKSHALVVGGTGMLRPISLALARQYVVSVVARNKARLQELVIEASQLGGLVNPICVDYESDEEFHSALEKATDKFGKFELAVIWIHRTASKAYFTVAEFVQGRYIHVFGSSTCDPANQQQERRARFAAMPHVRYQEVILGFVIQPTGSRWLTNEEIWKGVLFAVEHQVPQHIVGTINPWSAKP